MEDFLARFVLDSTYSQIQAQYFDFGVHNTLREYFENGLGHKLYVVAPEPNPGKDGYYYYIYNMDKVKVPTIAILAEHGVGVEEVLRVLMNAKTPNPNDEYHVIYDTAHIDLPLGLKASTEMFPAIGAWLEKVRIYGVTPH